jgi:hypothetical protein
VGPVLIAGDAAHTFSPAGGQGMNTGIQDAINLGWKLALLATRGVPQEPLLSSYETERRDIAFKILALTHLLFWVEAGTCRVPSFLRGTLGPLAAPIIPVLLRQKPITAPGIRVLSQMRWNYRHRDHACSEQHRPGAPATACLMPRSWWATVHTSSTSSPRRRVFTCCCRVTRTRCSHRTSSFMSTESSPGPVATQSSCAPTGTSDIEAPLTPPPAGSGGWAWQQLWDRETL